jgi:hypothetical protein
MPQVHYVKAARPCKSPETLTRREAAGIEVGEPYYWWTFYKSPPCFSRTRPRASQLTQSKWRDVYAAQEALDSALDAATLLNALTAAIDTLEAVKSEYESAAAAIEEKFEGSPTAEQCRQKADHLEGILGELGDHLTTIEGLEDEGDTDEEAFGDAKQEILDLAWDAPC